jgi:multidrug resistance efflux pump
MKSGYVLLGIVLLIATLFGAKLVHDHDSTASAKSKADAVANKPPEWILGWGFFDVKSGVAPLNPRQFGNITFVAEENKDFNKDEVLMQVDDKLAKLKVKEAEADVDASTQQLALANQLTRLYELQQKQQEALIRSIDHETNTLKLKRDRETLPLNNQPLKETIEKFYVEGLAQLAEKKKSEEAKLDQIKLQDAKLKIAQAQADLGAKNVRLEQAKEMLNHFVVKAPSKGTVLRVHVHTGETLGPNPLRPAMEFLPKTETVVKAEVLQEWGRFVKENQVVEIEDDTYHGLAWEGTVKSVSKWYAPPRSTVLEPFRLNDVRTLEVIISVEKADDARNGQRVRAKIKIQ